MSTVWVNQKGEPEAKKFALYYRYTFITEFNYKICNKSRDVLTLSYTAIIGIASFAAVEKNGRCKNNGDF